VQRFPDYAALSKPLPLAVSDVSSLLTDDEALVLIDLGKRNIDASYVWVVGRSGAIWKTIDAKAEDLETKIAALRASLDPTSNKPFDAKLAYELYKLILGPVEDNIAKKPRLLMVMNGALTSLPPQVLVTSDPAGKDLKSTDWLIRRQAIAILPSVYSLKVLRAKNAKVAAVKPLIGFGDPVFQRGVTEVGTRTASNRGYASFYRAGTADLDVLAKALPPLPETADELRAVAKSLGAGEADLRLGSAATVTRVKQTKLDQYRVVYFATHALVSGETEQAAKGLAEPALVLSLPATATAFDDGLLTSSEVAQFTLNADWVVLSACNTAAAEKPGAEALSGLARAFFYAGARSLLVSHWPVESEPTVKLMTTVFASIAKNPKLTTADALRQAMLAMLDDRTNPEWANPTSWAPFVLVGDGGVIDTAALEREEDVGARQAERRTQIVSFIKQYDGGECFYAAPTLVAENTANIEGFGSSVAPFEVLDAEFKRANGFHANIGLHQVTPPQCAAVTFLSRVRNEPGHPPRPELSTASAQGGITGAVTDFGDRYVDLLLVADDGAVFNVSQRLRPGADAHPSSWAPRVIFVPGGRYCCSPSPVATRLRHGTRPRPARPKRSFRGRSRRRATPGRCSMSRRNTSSSTNESLVVMRGQITASWGARFNMPGEAKLEPNTSLVASFAGGVDAVSQSLEGLVRIPFTGRHAGRKPNGNLVRNASFLLSWWAAPRSGPSRRRVLGPASGGQVTHQRDDFAGV